jgi:PrtD family type I secretion system ABC transporter
MSRSDSDIRPTEGPLRAALNACRRHLAYAGGFSAVINFLYIAPTIYMLQVYDRVVPTRGVTTLAFLTILLLATLATLSLLEMLRTRLLVRTSARLEKLVARPILTATMNRQLGAKAPQAMKDFDQFRQTITGPGILALFDAPWTLVYVGLCFLLHPLLGAMAVVGSGALFSLTLLTEKTVRPRLDVANKAAAWFYASQAQTASSSDLVRALGMQEPMVRRHERERLAVTARQAEASFTAGRYLGITKFIRLSLQSLALGAAAWLAVGQHISGGAIFAASLLIARALSPIEQVLASWRSLAEAHNAYGSLQSLLTQLEAEPPRTQLPAPAGRMMVERLAVVRPGAEAPILQNVSFNLNPGRVLGLVGPSGGGKTTLVRALVGAVTPSQGRVRLDGADLTDWDPDRLGRHLGYMPQDIGLLQGTVKQNICRFRDMLGDEDMERIDAKAVAAAQAAGAHDMILKLPMGYDTPLDWGGRGLSLGQAQRVALARAIYDEPQFVALDEPNAHLDGEGEAMLVKAVQDMKARGAAVVLVAHRSSMLEVMDELLVLSGGRVAHYGPREEILRRLAPQQPKPIAQYVRARQSA